MSKKKFWLPMLLCGGLLAGISGLAAAEKEQIAENEVYLPVEWEQEETNLSVRAEEAVLQTDAMEDAEIIESRDDGEIQIISPEGNEEEQTYYLSEPETKESENAIEYEWKPEPAVAEMIADAIVSGDDMIMLYQDIAVDSTICIPQGRSVTFCAADGVNAVVRRAEKFEGAIFEVERGAVLMLGDEEYSRGALTLDDTRYPDSEGFLIQGSGVVKINSAVNLKGDISDEIILETEDTEGCGESYDLNDAEIIFADTEPIIYNGEEKKPSIQVTIGSLTLTRLDYTVTYSNNINAGTALVTVTGKGGYTGTKSASFSISPYPVKYEMSDQSIETGTELSQITVPEAAAGVNGEQVYGTLLWSDSKEGAILPPNMLLSGEEGDSMILYWTFLPETENYASVCGDMKIMFREPEIKGNINTGLNMEGMKGGWENSDTNTGDLSTGTSAQGTTKGEGVTLLVTDEPKEIRSDHEEKENDTNGINRNTDDTAGIPTENRKMFAAGSRKDTPMTGDDSIVFFWGIMMLAAFLVSTGSMLSIIMRKV